MKHLYRLLLIVILLPCFSLTCVYAKDGIDHNKDLERVLFGGRAGTSQKEAAKVLEAAAYLTIDQFKGDGQSKLDLLNDELNKQFPKLSEFDIPSTENSHHREFTHQGWDSKHRKIKRNKNLGVDKDWPEKWEMRKKILQDTVEGVFDFNWWNEIPLIGNLLPEYGKQCDSLCALIYYTHLLGDHQETTNLQQYNYLMPLGGTIRGNDIINELIYHCEVLFQNENSINIGFSMFEGELKRINSKCFFLGKVDTEDKIENNKEYATRVLVQHFLSRNADTVNYR